MLRKNLSVSGDLDPRRLRLAGTNLECEDFHIAEIRRGHRNHRRAVARGIALVDSIDRQQRCIA